MMGILLNGYDLGCLWIKECVQIPVQYGHYNVVVKYLDKVMTKYKGIGMEFDITPDNRIMYLKVERVIPGYTATVVVEQATPEEMPPLQWYWSVERFPGSDGPGIFIVLCGICLFIKVNNWFIH